VFDIGAKAEVTIQSYDYSFRLSDNLGTYPIARQKKEFWHQAAIPFLIAEPANLKACARHFPNHQRSRGDEPSEDVRGKPTRLPNKKAIHSFALINPTSSQAYTYQKIGGK
jgi:hypothetical protein